MIDILLISDQPRLHDILALTGKLPDGSFRIATSLNQGVEEMAKTPPDIIFLQNRLSGLAGYILVRHVREEAGPASTKIVLLSDATGGGENSSADIELLTGVSDNELSDAISEIIGDHLGLPQNVPAPSEQKLLTSGGDPTPQQLVPEITDNVSLSGSVQPVIHPPVSPDPSSGNLQNRSKQPDENPGSQATIESSNPPPIQWEKKRLAVAISIISVLLAAVLLATLLLRATPEKTIPKKVTTKPVAQPAVKPVQTPVSSNTRQLPAPVQKSTAPLPSFIPATGIDTRYSVTNPGWERYTSAAREYKIFSESGTIKAIQVLDRQSKGISPAFFSSAIREIAKVRDYRAVSKEVKGDFLVKKGKLSKSADIILYKNRADTILRAFVIYFKKQENIPENKGHK